MFFFFTFLYTLSIIPYGLPVLEQFFCLFWLYLQNLFRAALKKNSGAACLSTRSKTDFLLTLK